MLRSSLLVSAVAIGLAPACLSAAGLGDAGKADSPRSLKSPLGRELGAERQAAARLVQSALEAELAGDSARRGELLDQALRTDPEYAPARWHRGQVRFDGQWRKLSDVQAAVSKDARRQEYRQLRAESADTLADHLALAEWCMRRGLTAEERVHWTKVLQADASHEQARQRLGLLEYQGDLYTAEQVEQLKREAKAAEKSMGRYKPIFLRLCRQAARGESSEREAALAKLRAVSDPAAIEALEYAVRKNSRDEKTTLDLNLAIVAALGNMPQHEATRRLLDYAVFATLPEVRYEAAAALRPRPKTDYVPLLMSALSAPIEGDISVIASPDGTVSVGENLSQAGPEADVSVVNSRDYVTIIPANRRDEIPRTIPAISRNIFNASALAWRRRQQIEQSNAQAAQLNARIESVLKNATDLTPPAQIDAQAGPQAWWQAWFDYNELYSEEHPTYEYVNTVADYSIAPAMSCFVAGTPIWTQTGPVLIERITVGDLVLSQDPVTGELDYRPVTGTTLRPPTRMVNIKLPEETITATAGHRFWVNGRGWEMAKFLAAGMPLHSLDGSLDIAAVGEEPEMEAHNLVVDDFHTYFVGQSKLLVHDNGCPRPTTAAVPGGEASK